MNSRAFHCLFTDICGNLKEKIVYFESTESLLADKVHFDGSSIKGFSDTNNSDLELSPDVSSVFNKNIIFCDVKHPADCRAALKQTTSNALKLGYEIKVGAELEFYLFRKENNKVDVLTRDNKLYMSPCSLRVKNIMDKISCRLKQLGIELESIHHEASNNQYEINFRFGDPVKIADEVVLIKQTLKHIAEQTNCYVSFMPKPFKNCAGSGMHTNLSIFKNGENIFASFPQNKTLAYFANGIMNHARAITAVSCPSINSYKRLNAKAECPNQIFMSNNDRTAFIRQPSTAGNTSRIEVRSPDISCNPYLCFAMLIEAGLNGIASKQSLNINNNFLPKTLSESLRELQSDEFLNNKFHAIINSYLKIKQSEIDDFNQFITDFEKLGVF